MAEVLPEGSSALKASNFCCSNTTRPDEWSGSKKLKTVLTVQLFMLRPQLYWSELVFSLSPTFPIPTEAVISQGNLPPWWGWGGEPARTTVTRSRLAISNDNWWGLCISHLPGKKWCLISPRGLKEKRFCPTCQDHITSASKSPMQSYSYQNHKLGTKGTFLFWGSFSLWDLYCRNTG